MRRIVKSLISAVIIIFMTLVMFPYMQPVEAAQTDKVHAKYQIRVDLTENLVFIDEWDSDSQAYVPTEHVFLCSPGKDSTPTPTGTFTTKLWPIDKPYDPDGTGEWVRFRSYASCYVNSVTQITPSICFHSVPYTKPDYKYISLPDMKLMGQPASHGCIRLWPRQAEWIRVNCGVGTTVKIYYGPGYNMDYWNLREALKKEIPTKDSYPNTVVTSQTKFIYTYFGDTLDGLAKMAEISADDLIKLNPDIDLQSGNIAVGLAVRIK
ncbi:MAG: L,D-transpeptidase family protein [Oscillospiraceae bacterium]|nr:L,D-transpeptidase family protein [Oscillospiraceae bacterium]